MHVSVISGVVSPMAIDMTGLKFGRYTVIKKAIQVGKKKRWWCRCECGIEKEVDGCHLRRGKIKSCGCLGREHLRRVATTHGKSKTPEYYIWCTMKQRCILPNAKSYANYGGRGISVFGPWIKDFPRFLSDVGERPSPELSLDRIDNNGNYEPGNVRWATPKQQAANKRPRIAIRGEKHRSSKLNDAQVLAIRVLYQKEHLFAEEIRNRLGLPVQAGTIRRIILNRHWKHAQPCTPA